MSGGWHAYSGLRCALIRVAREMDRIVEMRGAPCMVVSDNGTGFIAPGATGAHMATVKPQKIHSSLYPDRGMREQAAPGGREPYAADAMIAGIAFLFRPKLTWQY